MSHIQPYVQHRAALHSLHVPKQWVFSCIFWICVGKVIRVEKSIVPVLSFVEPATGRNSFFSWHWHRSRKQNRSRNNEPNWSARPAASPHSSANFAPSVAWPESVCLMRVAATCACRRKAFSSVTTAFGNLLCGVHSEVALLRTHCEELKKALDFHPYWLVMAADYDYDFALAYSMGDSMIARAEEPLMPDRTWGKWQLSKCDYSSTLS